jgi:acetyl esterase
VTSLLENKYEIRTEDVVYQHRDGQDWLTRIYQPVGDGPFPTIIEVHGECWTGGDRTKNRELLERLATHGVLSAALEYHQPPNGAYPDPMLDINLGARWFKAHAAEYGGTSRIGAFGSSSGGHQVTLLGMQPDHPVYSALPGEPGYDASLAYVVGGWPVIDPLYRYRLLKSSGPDYHPQSAQYIGRHDRFWGTEEAMAEGSPQVLLDKGTPSPLQTPPLLFVQREVDRLHPREMQERFIESYRAAGGDAEMIVFPRIPRPFGLTSEDRTGTDKDGDLVVAEILTFIQRHA